MTIDTLAYTKHLEQHGFTRDQAEASAEAMNSHVLPDLATKQDLRLLGSELKQAISDLKVTLITAMIAIAGLTIGLAKLLP